MPAYLLDLDPGERQALLQRLDEETLRALWVELGVSGLPPEDAVELFADVLDSVPPQERFEGVLAKPKLNDVLAMGGGVRDVEQVPFEQRLRLLAGLRDSYTMETDSGRYARMYLMTLRAGLQLNVQEHPLVFEEVALAEADMGGSLLIQPVCAPEGSYDFYAEGARELGLNLLVTRARSAAFLGFGDEHLGDLEQAVEMLATMRASYEQGVTSGVNRAVHVDGILGLVDAYLFLRHFDRAENLIEGALAEPLLVEELRPGAGRRGDLEHKLRLAWGQAGIGTELGALRRDPDAERFAKSFALFQQLVEDLGQLPGEDETAANAKLWMSWIELERAAEEATEAADLEPIRQLLEETQGPLVEGNPSLRRFRKVLEARLLRLEQGEGGVDRRRELLDEVERDLIAEWDDIPARRGGLGPTRDLRVKEFLGERLALELESGDGLAAVRATVLAVERIKALGSQPRLLGAQPGDVEAALAALTADGRAVLYFLQTGFGPARVALIEEDRVTLGATARYDLIEHMEKGATGALAVQPSHRKPDRLGKFLLRARDDLLEPSIQARLADLERVAVIGLEPLLDLPFAALPWPSDSKQTYGANLALVELPSLSVAGVLARRELPESPAALLLVTEPDTLADGSVPAVGLPKGSIERLSKGTTASAVLSGSDATLAELKRRVAGSDKPDALVMIAHGERVPGVVRSMGIQLAPLDGDALDGVLLPADVERLDLSGVGLAVLAACRAGNEPDREGDGGSATLAGAFLRAGAAATLDADGELPTEATVELIEELMKAWRAGHPLDEALRRARAAIAADPARRDPFFHSQLRLIAVPGA